jgi:putative oxidoreductase
MNRAIELWQSLCERLEGLGRWLAPLGLRLILAWEFWEAGREKFSGSNWFMDIQGKFPFPFDRVPTSLSWSLATWTELLGAIALVLGLATRGVAFALFVLTVVATAAVHWPSDWMMFSDLAQGYAITDRGHGNFKLPLLFMVMLVPLILRGAGALSLDALLARRAGIDAQARPNADTIAWGLGAVALGIPLAMLFPVFGLALAGAGVLLLLLGRWLTH